MKVALLTTDAREILKDYGKPDPGFGTAPEALMQGFALLPDVEVHVVSCARYHPEVIAWRPWKSIGRSWAAPNAARPS